MPRDHLLWLAVAFEGGLFLLAAGLAWLFGLPLRNMATWEWSHVAWGLAATLPPLAALWWLETSSLPPLRRFRETIDRLVTPLFDDCTWLDFAVISLVAGVGEESLFRGVLQYGLDRWSAALGLEPWVATTAAILFAGLVFGLVHWITRAYALYATLMGVYLGVLFVWFDNLLVPMIVHGVYDFVALIWVTGSPGEAGSEIKVDPASDVTDNDMTSADKRDRKTIRAEEIEGQPSGGAPAPAENDPGRPSDG